MKKSQQAMLDDESLLTCEPHALHEFVADKFESALGRPLPQLEIRVNDLSLSANITAIEESNGLPTISHVIKKAVVVTKKHVVRKQILKNVSAVFRPGTMTLVLGQPGSGKSALMKVLSGRFPAARDITIDGCVTYNGQDLERIRRRLPQLVAYIPQRDHHHSSLTVKETLEYAHKFSGGEFFSCGGELFVHGTPEQNQSAVETAKALDRVFPEIVVNQLGLHSCEDTIVGDAATRGVSGGERKRVTTGEMEFGMKYATFMDEISTGLDSAATYDIITTQRSIAKTLGKTIVVSLLQPSPEVLALFDDVIILNDGEIMYHGPCERVTDYFKTIGFVCPPERDVADYLLDLGTKQQRRYQMTSLTTHPRSASEFADMFKQSEIFQDTLRALEKPHDPSLLATVDTHMSSMPEFQLPFWKSYWEITKREFTVCIRNAAFMRGRLFNVVLNTFLIASTYWQFDPTDVKAALGTVFLVVLFMANDSIPQVPVYMATRDVFYKQRGANFFQPSAYVLACLSSQLPMAIAETVFLGSIVYWGSGFGAGFAGFLQYEAIVLLTHMAFGGWFFFVGAVAPSVNIGNPMAMVSILWWMMFAGFIVTKDSIPAYFIWIYWLSPLTWAVRAIAIILYRSDTYSVCEFGGIDYCTTTGMDMGEYYLSRFSFQTDKAWIWLGMIALIALYAFFILLSCLALECKRYENVDNVVLAPIKAEEEDSYVAIGTPRESVQSNRQLNLSVSVVKTDVVPVTLAFTNLWYSVSSPSNSKEPIDLLKGISGYALPGTMTALMGSSGAGKTTLMDVIAGRKTGGQIRGNILLNGYPATDLAIRRCTGYCEQMDIHMEASTIREALAFSAFLRQDSSIPDGHKYDSVSECLSLLGLDDIADQMIRGSSVEQMKRVTIGVELAADPSILFLDEPTSGLDARYAKKVMDGVRKVANTGRTIICTIHQPSAEVFFLFDSLLLLKRGGEMVFFGELGDNARSMVEYFEAVPDVKPIAPGANPAAWMLEYIGAGFNDTSANETDFVHHFLHSKCKQSMDAVMEKEGVSRPSQDSPEMIFTAKRAASSYTQMKFLLCRHLRLYWRTPAYNLTRIMISLGLALLFGLVSTGVDFKTYGGISSGVGLLYMAAFFCAWVSYQSIVPLTTELRGPYYRERASQTYSALWYFVGETLAEIPYGFVVGLVFTVVFFPMVGFTGFWTGVQFWLVFSLNILAQTYLGMFVVYLVSSGELAGVICILLTSTFYMFAGFNPPSNAVPAGYQWLHDITPQRFPISILMSLVFCDCPTEPTWDERLQQFTNIGSALGCQPLVDAPVTMGHITIKGFVEQVYEYKHARMSTDLASLIAYVVVFRVLGLLAMRFLNHTKR